MNLKTILKTFKLNESTISMALGVFVILAIGAIVINYFRTQNQGVTTPNSATTVQENSTPEEHTVLSGESLWTISEKYYEDGYKWIEIAKINNLQNPSQIEVGQKIKLPSVSTPSATAENTSTPEASPVALKTPTATPLQTESPTPTNNEVVSPPSDFESPISGDSYTVQKGDNLWNIAVRAYGNGYKWVEISNQNKLANPNIIHSGNILRLPR